MVSSWNMWIQITDKKIKLLEKNVWLDKKNLYLPMHCVRVNGYATVYWLLKIGLLINVKTRPWVWCIVA